MPNATEHPAGEPETTMGDDPVWEACWNAVANAAWPAGGAERSEVLVMLQTVRPPESRLAAVEAVAATATPGMSLPPLDCTYECNEGPCNCSGEYRPISWRIDLPALRDALRGTPSNG